MTQGFKCYFNPLVTPLPEEKKGRRRPNAVFARTKHFQDAMMNAAETGMCGK